MKQVFSLLANLRTLKQMNDQGVNMSPRDQPPSVGTRFEATNDSFQSPRPAAVNEASPMMQAAGMARHYRFVWYLTWNSVGVSGLEIRRKKRLFVVRC